MLKNIKRHPIFALIDNVAEEFSEHPECFNDLTGDMYLSEPENIEDGEAQFYCGPAVQYEHVSEPGLSDQLGCYTWMARVLDPIVKPLGFEIDYGAAESLHIIRGANEEQLKALWPKIKEALAVPGIDFVGRT